MARFILAERTDPWRLAEGFLQLSHPRGERRLASRRRLDLLDELRGTPIRSRPGPVSCLGPPQGFLP